MDIPYIILVILTRRLYTAFEALGTGMAIKYLTLERYAITKGAYSLILANLERLCWLKHEITFCI
jgi:hypothetical protein